MIISLLLIALTYSSFNAKPQKVFGTIEEQALEVDFFKTTRFNTNNNKYFKFKYEKNESKFIYIYLLRKGDEVRLTDSNGNNIENAEIFYEEDHLFAFYIDTPGEYILEFYNPKNLNPFAVDNEFTIILPGEIIDTIDLSQKMYYNPILFYSRWNISTPCKYKVKDLAEDTYVYFVYGGEKSYYKDYKNPFEICIDNNCQKNINIYKLQKKTEYTINIYFVNTLYDDDYYYYLPFIFFPIRADTFGIIEKGMYKSADPKIYSFNIKNENDKIYLLNLNCEYFYLGKSSQPIKKENIEQLKDITFQNKKENLIIEKSKSEYYYIIVAIPPIVTNEFMDQSTRIVIFDELIKKLNDEYKEIKPIPSKKHALIYLKSRWDYDDEDDLYSSEDDNEVTYLSGYNRLISYSSPKKNMQFVMSNQTDEFDFLIENSYKNPIYIKPADEDINITIDLYYPRYSFFGAMTPELYKSYLSFLLKSYSRKTDLSEKSEVVIDPKLYLPINIRINSDYNDFYEFFNFYIKDFKENVNVYINKIYGDSEFYECSDESIDKNDLSILTKPITNCINSKSIFNRLFSFKGSKIVSGYLSPNSYFDIYVEYNDDENNIIKLSSVSDNTANSASKYIRKNIEYKIDFDLDHMIKIDKEINAEVTIYNKNNNIKLNSDNPVAKVEGKNFFLRTNADTMIYFYGKLNSYIRQIKIDPSQKGNILIRSNNYYKIYYCIDIGFEGYNPLNSVMKNRIRIRPDEPIYIENIYEKVKNKLYKNENLYFYYANGKVDEVKINLKYINENLNHPNNDYSFHVIPKGSENKRLVINNLKDDREIRMGVHFCKKETEVKVYSKRGDSYYDEDEREEVSTFSYNGQEYEDLDFEEFGIEFRFESSEEFIFSYSYFDKSENDNAYYYKDEWILERKVLNDSNITNIENSHDNIISITFNPNYINSTTKYIIIIAPEEGDNTIDNFNNPCYIAKLATEKPTGVKIKNFFFAGENEQDITTEVDIGEILNNNGKYIVNIISQELRFEKRLNFYNPKTFEYKLNIEEVNIGVKKEFDLSNNKTYFNLQLKEEVNENKMLLLHYILDSENSMTIKINNPKNQGESFNINNKEGFINFLYDKSGTYQIHFIKTETQKLRSNNNGVKGTFKIVSTDELFDLDINQDKIEFREFTINARESPSIKFSIGKLDKDLTKKFLISNYDYNNINQIVSIKKDSDNIKDLNLNYYTFRKDSNYEVTIKFHKKDENYVLEKVNILDIPSLEVSDIFSNIKKFNDINDKFYIINWKNIEKISISKLSKDPTFLFSHISDSQSKNLAKEIQDIEFKKLDNLEITKPNGNDYSVLMIKLEEYGTEVNIDLKMNNKNDDDYNHDDDDDDDDDDKTLYIILISVLGGIILILILILIIRCIQKKKENSNNYEQKAKDIDNEKLLQDI